MKSNCFYRSRSSGTRWLPFRNSLQPKRSSRRFVAHAERYHDICEAGKAQKNSGNHRTEAIGQRCQQLSAKLEQLDALAARRKAWLIDNSAYLQFVWKADFVELDRR